MGALSGRLMKGMRASAALDGIFDYRQLGIPNFDTTPAEYRRLLREFRR